MHIHSCRSSSIAILSRASPTTALAALSPLKCANFNPPACVPCYCGVDLDLHVLWGWFGLHIFFCANQPHDISGERRHSLALFFTVDCYTIPHIDIRRTRTLTWGFGWKAFSSPFEDWFGLGYCFAVIKMSQPQNDADLNAHLLR